MKSDMPRPIEKNINVRIFIFKYYKNMLVDKVLIFLEIAMLLFTKLSIQMWNT